MLWPFDLSSVDVALHCGDGWECALTPVVHDQLLGFIDVEGEVVVLGPH